MAKGKTGKSVSRPKDDARERIVNAASRLYAEHGFDVPLSRIARAAKVSPAVLTRSVGTKKALLERVFKQLFAGRWKPEWDALLVDRSLPLEERLVRFFVAYRGNIERSGARLWTRAGLLGRHKSGNFSATLAKRILIPMIRELRHEAGLAGAVDRDVTGEELELAMVLHAAIAFPHTRSHIFGMDVHGGLEELVPMMVRVWLPGAKMEIRRLNG
jgi:AcrR family transcriptional regulator